MFEHSEHMQIPEFGYDDATFDRVDAGESICGWSEGGHVEWFYREQDVYVLAYDDEVLEFATRYDYREWFCNRTGAGARESNVESGPAIIHVDCEGLAPAQMLAHADKGDVVHMYAEGYNAHLFRTAKGYVLIDDGAEVTFATAEAFIGYVTVVDIDDSAEAWSRSS